MTPFSILIIRLSSIGDIILTSPVIETLKHNLPECSISFAIKTPYSSLLEHNPHIDTIVCTDNMESIYGKPFDLVVDLQNNLKSFWIRQKVRSKQTNVVNKKNIRKYILTAFGIDTLHSEHIVDRYLKTIQKYCKTSYTEGLNFYINPEKIRFKNPYIHSKYVVCVLGATYPNKQLKAQTLIEVCKHISQPILLIGGKNDIRLADAICSTLPNKAILDTCGKLNFHESAQCVKDASLVISNDTGYMHIASAFKQKIISVWGCTSPKLGMYPYKPHPHSIMIEPSNRRRRPCSKLGNRCRYKRPCIENINANDIISAVKTLS